MTDATMSEATMSEATATGATAATTHAATGAWARGLVGRAVAWRTLGAIMAGALALALLGLASAGAAYERLAVPAATEVETSGGEIPRGREADLAARLARRAPRGLYLVVDTWGNRVRLYRDSELLREMVSSTGSGAFLRDPVTGRTWTFETPRGERRIQRKAKNPVWIKPDWAFIEEGFEPPKNAVHRVDDVSLGDYALYLGDGYLIHGTLFQTLLGQRITHGCIRLGDDDLAYLYRNLPVGARVYLY